LQARATEGPFTQVLLSSYERRRSQREVVNEMPLYPTEGLLWDESQVWRGGGHRPRSRRGAARALGAGGGGDSLAGLAPVRAPP
jgi:hypothetical protein